MAETNDQPKPENEKEANSFTCGIGHPTNKTTGKVNLNTLNIQARSVRGFDEKKLIPAIKELLENHLNP